MRYSSLAQLNFYICSMKRAIIPVLLLFMTACIPNEADFEGFTRTELQRILSGGTTKKWELIYRDLDGIDQEIGNCEANPQLVLEFTGVATDRDSAFFVNYKNDCSTPNDTLKGYWFVPDPGNRFAKTDSLVLVWEGVDSASFTFHVITPVTFRISTALSDSLYEEFDVLEVLTEEEIN